MDKDAGTDDPLAEDLAPGALRPWRYPKTSGEGRSDAGRAIVAR